MNKKKMDAHVTTKKEGNDMAVLAKPINRVTVISDKDSRKFVHEFNENKVSKEFLNSCKRAGELFARKK